jgi:preprotein translocase subunit SecE
MLILYITGIVIAKRKQRLTPGTIIVLIFLAIAQTLIIVVDMYFRKPPEQ